MSAPLEPRDPPPSPEHFERLIGKVLSEQPVRRAPRTLQARVLAAIEQHAALPWWRNSFLHWPLAARTLFVLVSFGIVKLAVSGAMALVSSIRSPVVDTIEKPLSWAESSLAVFAKTVNLTTIVLNAIPPLWLYAGIALAATLYLCLLVLGATAYRTLYVNK